MDSRSGPTGRHGRGAHPDRARADLPGFTDDDHAIAQLLAGLADTATPTSAERDRMRARLMAEIAGPPKPSPQPRRQRPARAGRAPRGQRSETASRTRPEPARTATGARARFAVASIAVLALVFSLAGMSLLLARDALPGDALYAVKRTGEAASLGLTFGDEDKAFKHLEFATARITEIETLAQRYPSGDDAPLGGYLSALSDFDNDAAAGSRQIIALASLGDGTQLDTLRVWAENQGARLRAVSPRMPAAAAMRQGTSLTLLSEIESRAKALAARQGCSRITSGSIDDIGALPETAACERRPDAPNPNVQAPPGGSSSEVVTAVPPTVQPTQPGTPEPGSTSGSQPPLVSVPPILGDPSLTTPPGSSPAAPTISLPLGLPLPTVEVPPLLGILPGIVIG